MHKALLTLSLILSRCHSQETEMDGSITTPPNYSKFYRYNPKFREPTHASGNGVIFRPIKDQDKQMEIEMGMVITQIIDIDFEEKSLNLNVEFIMKWKDEFVKLNVGYDNKVSLLTSPSLSPAQPKVNKY